MPLFEPPPLPGDQVDSYQLLETLGIGGNATVYKATCPEHGHIALKVLHPGKTTEEDIKRFHREYVSLQRLNHPNIVRVYKTGIHNDYPWLSMELVEGSDLSDLIENWKQSEAVQKYVHIKRILLKMCDAIEYFHQQGMIHRDLKPSNVLITKEGSPKITDFGGVKAPSTFQSELTTMGKLVGTVAFMAPEHILGETLDKRADLYSLGALLYMCLTGNKPFEAKNIAGYLSLHLTTPPPNPQASCPDIPKDLNEICLQLMQKDREERIQSAQEVINKLNKKVSTNSSIGLEEERNQVNELIHAFLKGQNTLLCLYGYRGTGKNSIIRLLLKKLQHHDIPIAVNKVGFPTKSKQLYVIDTLQITPEVLQNLKNQINEGVQLFVLITSPTKVIFFEEALGIPCEKVYVRPLLLGETQSLLSQHKITGKSNLLLSKRYHTLFKGRLEYMAESLSLLKDNETFKISISNARSIKIPIPNSVKLNNKHLLSKLTPHARQILECLLVYNAHLDDFALMKLCQQDDSDFRAALLVLQSTHWVSVEQINSKTTISLEKHHLCEILYQLIQRERRVGWHKRIAAILSKKRRRTREESLLLAHHLERAERFGDAFKELLRAAEKSKSEQSLKELSTTLENAEKLLYLDCFESSDSDLYTLYCLSEFLHTKRANTTAALNYNQKAMTLTINEQQRAEIEVRSSLLSYNSVYSHRSLPLLQKDNPIWLDGTMNSAIHEFLEGNIDAARKCWTELIAHSNPLAKNVGQAGIYLIGAIDGSTEVFFDYLQNHHQTLPDYWLIWLIENYICVGRWKDALLLAQDISERLYNHPIFCTRALALEGLIHVFMGKPSHAYQAISSIQETLLTPYDVSSARSAIHIARLHLAIGKDLPLYTFNWNELTPHIDDLRAQWLTLLNRHRQQPSTKIPTVAIPWTQDLLLYDLAFSVRVNPSLSQLENIWQQINEQSVALRMVIAKHFYFVTNKTIWKKRFLSNFKACKKYTDQFYDYSNWEH